jgi:hypothetical protein
MGKSSNHRFKIYLDKEKFEQNNPWKNYAVVHRKLQQEGIDLAYKSFNQLINNKVGWGLIYGLAICKLLDVKLEDIFSVLETEDHVENPDSTNDKAEPLRKTTKIKRVVRNINKAQHLKLLYKDTCQLCGTRILINHLRRYSECHHMKPLAEHMGIDHWENMIIVCPNHHKMFDRGAIAIHPDTKKVFVVDGKGSYREAEDLVFTCKKNHHINPNFLKYHWQKIFLKNIKSANKPLKIKKVG